ncbi:hypothetical protein SDC9_65272 [bioreactor metagenome]|jgi:hypothetical protein|uniref:Transposase n=1 Tax=bioreactor metagenome TaxID=1076179 RepID=A0A644XRU0_9ZZZZ
MCSDERNRKAIESYLKYGVKAVAVIRELGYPNRLTLRQWFQSPFMSTLGDIPYFRERSCGSAHRSFA